VFVLVQYRSLSLQRHLEEAWGFLPRTLDEFISPVPPQMHEQDHWYQGTANAIYQNLYLVEQMHPRPKRVLVLSGDHIYKMNYAGMLDFHAASGAALTVATIEVDRASASSFGVLEVDPRDRVIGFEEKPLAPRPLPGRPEKSLASMGIYVFETDLLFEVLERDARNTHSSHDFGRDVIPSLIPSGGVFAYQFRDENRGTAQYWRDVGTIDAYFQASMDLVKVTPELNLYDQDWPIRTFQVQAPPPKFVFAQTFEGGQLGVALDSMVSPGAIISGARVQSSILSPWVRVEEHSNVDCAILLDGARVGRHCRIRKAIIDRNATIPDGTVIGFDPEEDRRRYVMSEGGVVVVTGPGTT
jgi:glucose-1-phosphate adenylyltransferase